MHKVMDFSHICVRMYVYIIYVYIYIYIYIYMLCFITHLIVSECYYVSFAYGGIDIQSFLVTFE